jgi:HlyD family secretion protein
VNTDRLLIEMSDLTNFKIQGSVEDDFYDHIKTGTRVYVGIDNQKLIGVIGTVDPVVKDRKIEFDVNLQESNHFKLRPNLSVDLEIAMAERDSVLRISNGPVIGRGKEHQVFVLTQSGVESREIRTGLKTKEYVEILEGLNEGERIVLSVVSSMEDLEGMEIR